MTRYTVHIKRASDETEQQMAVVPRWGEAIDIAESWVAYPGTPDGQISVRITDSNGDTVWSIN